MANNLLELATSVKCPDSFDWLHGINTDRANRKLAVEVDNTGLTFREPLTPKDGGCSMPLVINSIDMLCHLKHSHNCDSLLFNI